MKRSLREHDEKGNLVEKINRRNLVDVQGEVMGIKCVGDLFISFQAFLHPTHFNVYFQSRAKVLFIITLKHSMELRSCAQREGSVDALEEK